MSSPSDKLYQIAALQLFDGSFNLDNSLCSLIQVNLNRATTETSSRGWNTKAYATTLALAFFMKKLESIQDKWELVADKSKIWLIASYAHQADSMFESAIKLVTGN